MASEYDSFKVLQVDCPRCEAKAGENCITSAGKKANDFHTARKAVVYPRFGKSVSGKPKQGVKGGNPATVRAQLRNAVIDAGIRWLEARMGTRLYSAENSLVDAVKALQAHRIRYPEIRG